MAWQSRREKLGGGNWDQGERKRVSVTGRGQDEVDEIETFVLVAI